MAEISKREGISPVELYMKIVRDGGASVVCHSMKEPDIRTFYRQPWVMVSSDGGIGSRHPRGAGTYPRVLGHYVRELQWLTLPEAIKKMTSIPAARFKLSDRGLIRPGFKADLVLFDPQTIIDRATFQNPESVAEGVKRVFVNGTEVWADGRVTGDRPGRALRRAKSGR
jgi:N-acyl-D-amino-acid deacylase